MEEMTIVRFFVDKEKRGKEKRWGSWRYFVSAKSALAGKEQVHLIEVHLPGFFYKNKTWTEKQRRIYLEGLCIPEEGTDTYYLFEKEAEAFLGMKNNVLPAGFLRLLLQNCGIRFSALVWLNDGEEGREELLEKWVRHTRYIGVVSPEELIEEWQETLWEEYGFLLEAAEEVSELHIPKEGRQLWITGRKLYGLKPDMLAQGAVFISTEVDGMGKNLCARAKDVKYLDIKCFLASLFP